MKYLLFLAPTLMLIGQEAAPKSSNLGVVSEIATKSVIVIDPKARTADLVYAFDLLRKDKPSQKIIVRTAAGILSNVVDLTPSSGGTLLFVKLLSTQGTRVQILPVEQILEIGYSP